MRIGVDLGGTKIEAVALDDAGRHRLRRRVRTPQEQGYDAVVRAVADLVEGLERELGARARVGIGTPGSLSPTSGLMRNSNTVCLNGRALDRDLEAALGRTIRLANDADCFALAEAVEGAGAGAATVFGVILGTGMGAGVVVHGRLLAGPNAVAGEWGHNPLPWPREDELPGPECYCGKRGCMETWLAGPSLAADHARRVHGASLDSTERPANTPVRAGSLTAEQIAALARAGDASAMATLDRHADRLARGLATIINVLDPHVVVLGGGLSNLPHLEHELPARWGRYVFSDAVRTRLARAKLGDSAGVLGAAWLWRTEPLDSP
jgi:fructokinase